MLVKTSRTRTDRSSKPAAFWFSALARMLAAMAPAATNDPYVIITMLSDVDRSSVQWPARTPGPCRTPGNDHPAKSFALFLLT